MKPRNIFVLPSFLSSKTMLAGNRQSMMMRCGHYKRTKIRAPAVLTQTLLSPLSHREGCIFESFQKLSSVQLLSHVRLFATSWTAACQASPSISNSQSLLKLRSIKFVMPSNLLILCCHLLFLPSVFSSIRVFSSESVLCIKWPKYWSFSFSIGPSNEYSGLISFRIDRFDLLEFQGTLKNLLQHHSWKVSIL